MPGQERRPARAGASVVATALVILAMGRPSAGDGEPAPARPPSILVVITDDMATGDEAHMPFVQRHLVDQGTSLSRFFVTTSICCPSRTSILRGQYAHNHGVIQNSPPLGGYATFRLLGHEQSHVATWLQDAGYRTANIGKYLLGYEPVQNAGRVPPGWTEWFSRSRRASLNFAMNDNGRIARFGSRREDYFTDVLAGRAESFLRSACGDGVPFLAFVATSAPHVPARAAPEDRGLFDGVEAPRTPAFDEIGSGSKPEFVDGHRPLTRGQVRRIDRLYRRRIESLQAVDRMMDRLVGVLEEAGRLDDTYIVFLSDNGFRLGRNRLSPGKATPYDDDVRVPLFVRGPGVPKGTQVAHLAANIDLAPTFAAIAGVEAPAYVDGRSLLPLLGAQPPDPGDWRRSLLLEYAPQVRRAARETREHFLWQVEARGDAEPAEIEEHTRQFFDWERSRGIPGYRGVRTDSLALIRYARGPGELYFMGMDPWQLHNQARYYPEISTPLGTRLRALSERGGVEARLEEDLPVPEEP